MLVKLTQLSGVAATHGSATAVQKCHTSQQIRFNWTVVQVYIFVVLEHIVARNHIFHAGPMQLGNETQPDRQLMCPEMVLHAWFHAYIKR